MSVPIESLLGGKRNEVVEKIVWDDYLKLAGLNPSTIVQAVRGREDDGELILSMKALKYGWDNPGQDTDDLRWGRALHCLLYERNDFERRYARWHDGKDRKGSAYADFQLDNWGKEILTAKQWDAALEAAQAFVSEPLVQEIIAEGQSEVTVFRVVDGIQCRGRLDFVRSRDLGLLISDLKTARSIAPRQFGSAFYTYHYDIKLGLYREWFSALQDELVPVTVVAQEKTPPYEVSVIPIPDAVLDYGAEKGRKIIKRVRRCIETGSWPGQFGNGEGYLHTPHYEMEDVELIGAEEVLAA